MLYPEEKRGPGIRYLQSWQVLHPPQGNSSSSTMRPQPAVMEESGGKVCAGYLIALPS